MRRPSALRSRRLPWPCCRIAGSAALLCTLTFVAVHRSDAYTLNGYKWPAGSEVVMQLGLGSTPRVLMDGSTSWNAAAAPALEMWNRNIGQMQFRGVPGTTGSVHNGDRVNSIVFSSTVFGQAFGKYTLAVTYYSMSGSTLLEADVLFNQAMVFDSYSGPLQFSNVTGIAIGDIGRVLLHELGHGIGLNHPDQAGQKVDAVMNAMISDRETLAPDDIDGAQRLYGPSTNPSPTPRPTPTPAPTPVDRASHLANISTRMHVGTDDNVLIGGFIVSGSQPKKLILRAIGPSLAATGMTGTMSDPTLELYASDGRKIAENDDWQSSAQAPQVAATGIAPTAQKESALIAIVPAGSYTAVVRGSGNMQGIAIVEAYELDDNSSRLVNISTRGRIGTGERALIGGLIITGSDQKLVIIRALGPSLREGGISGALANPTLELHDGSGNLIIANDDWASGSQASEITATGVPPREALESAVIARLAPGTYTAVVQGANDTTGVGLVEVFDLD